jgi:hypothetical protein
MSLKKLALKPGELKPLDRAALVLLAARCALRVAPWVPRASAALAKRELARVLADAFAGAQPDATQRARALAELGAREQNRAPDDPLARCRGYALSTLAEAVAATALADRADVVKLASMGAKLAASMPAILAHAGLVITPSSVRASPVDYACGVTWAAIRVDVKAVAFACSALEPMGPRKRLATLHTLAPLWPGRTPSWAAPG